MSRALANKLHVPWLSKSSLMYTKCLNSTIKLKNEDTKAKQASQWKLFAAAIDDSRKDEGSAHKQQS